MNELMKWMAEPIDPPTTNGTIVLVALTVGITVFLAMQFARMYKRAEMLEEQAKEKKK